MYDKDYENKGECDLHDKRVKNKGDADLYIGCKSWDEMVREFVFKKEDKGGGSAKNWVVFGRGVISQGSKNFVLLIYQYLIIFGSVIIQSFSNRFY